VANLWGQAAWPICHLSTDFAWTASDQSRKSVNRVVSSDAWFLGRAARSGPGGLLPKPLRPPFRRRCTSTLHIASGMGGFPIWCSWHWHVGIWFEPCVFWVHRQDMRCSPCSGTLWTCHIAPVRILDPCMWRCQAGRHGMCRAVGIFSVFDHLRTGDFCKHNSFKTCETYLN